MSEAEKTWYWEDSLTGNRYWESGGITYLVYVEDGELKLKEVSEFTTKDDNNEE